MELDEVPQPWNLVSDTFPQNGIEPEEPILIELRETTSDVDSFINLSTEQYQIFHLVFQSDQPTQAWN